MEIEVNGKIIELKVTSLGDPMDSFLKGFFTKFLSNISNPYPEFIKDTYNELRENIHSYFDSDLPPIFVPPTKLVQLAVSERVGCRLQLGPGGDIPAHYVV